jgi:hypothetical protein
VTVSKERKMYLFGYEREEKLIVSRGGGGGGRFGMEAKRGKKRGE